MLVDACCVLVGSNVVDVSVITDVVPSGIVFAAVSDIASIEAVPADAVADGSNVLDEVVCTCVVVIGVIGDSLTLVLVACELVAVVVVDADDVCTEVVLSPVVEAFSMTAGSSCVVAGNVIAVSVEVDVGASGVLGVSDIDVSVKV